MNVISVLFYFLFFLKFKLIILIFTLFFFIIFYVVNYFLYFYLIFFILTLNIQNIHLMLIQEVTKFNLIFFCHVYFLLLIILIAIICKINSFWFNFIIINLLFIKFNFY